MIFVDGSDDLLFRVKHLWLNYGYLFRLSWRILIGFQALLLNDWVFCLGTQVDFLLVLVDLVFYLLADQQLRLGKLDVLFLNLQQIHIFFSGNRCILLLIFGWRGINESWIILSCFGKRLIFLFFQRNNRNLVVYTFLHLLDPSILWIFVSVSFFFLFLLNQIHNFNINWRCTLRLQIGLNLLKQIVIVFSNDSQIFELALDRLKLDLIFTDAFSFIFLICIPVCPHRYLLSLDEFLGTWHTVSV